jgi:periplasmic protein CpxP/Spy
MKRILVLMLAMVTIVAAQAQKERVPEQRGHRDKMMAEKLKLSEEQKQKAKTLNEDYRKKMDELRKKDDILVKDWRNQMMELNKKHREDMQDLLSKEQKAQIEKMKVERKKIAGIDANARMEKMKLRLDLSNDQMERIKKQRIETLDKMKVIRENRSQDMMKKRVEMKALIQKRNENMKSILNEEQMKKMQEMRKTMPRKRRVVS